jgi:CDP-diacylglycerol--serine O-phosphatidyltransferase
MEASPKAAVSPKHFSMIRAFHLADVFTLANAACGVAAIGMAMRALVTQRVQDLLIAAAFAPAALLFDVVDGRVARWRQTSSALGRELDSLADVISFGVAPAALAYACGLVGAWDALVLVYFVCCGVSRLARYNVTAESMAEETGKVTYFEGTPIPTSVLLTAVFAWCAWQRRIGPALPGGVWTFLDADLHPLTLLFALSGTLMVSKTLRIPKL